MAQRIAQSARASPHHLLHPRPVQHQHWRRTSDRIGMRAALQNRRYPASACDRRPDKPSEPLIRTQRHPRARRSQRPPVSGPKPPAEGGEGRTAHREPTRKTREGTAEPAREARQKPSGEAASREIRRARGRSGWQAPSEPGMPDDHTLLEGSRESGRLRASRLPLERARPASPAQSTDTRMRPLPAGAAQRRESDGSGGPRWPSRQHTPPSPPATALACGRAVVRAARRLSKQVGKGKSGSRRWQSLSCAAHSRPWCRSCSSPFCSLRSSI